MIAFILGMMVGGSLGVVVFALCAINKCEDCMMAAARDSAVADMMNIADKNKRQAAGSTIGPNRIAE